MATSKPEKEPYGSRRHRGEHCCKYHLWHGTSISIPIMLLIIVYNQYTGCWHYFLGYIDNCYQTLVQDATGVPDIEPYADFTHTYNHNQNTSLEARSTQATYPIPTFQATSYTTYGPASNGTPGNIPYFNNGPKPCTFQENHDWSSHEHIGGTFTPSYSADGPTEMHTDSLHHKPQPLYARMCKRTVALCGLPVFTTLGDVTSVVRGGQLLDVFLRSAEHIASVSFVREDDAVQFYEHARKNDIYIKNKRVCTDSFYSNGSY